MLYSHNLYRSRHQVPLLTLNASINSIAQKYATYLSANNLFQHSGAAGLGENLASMSSSVKYLLTNCSSIIWQVYVLSELSLMIIFYIDY